MLYVIPKHTRVPEGIHTYTLTQTHTLTLTENTKAHGAHTHSQRATPKQTRVLTGGGNTRSRRRRRRGRRQMKAKCANSGGNLEKFKMLRRQVVPSPSMLPHESRDKCKLFTRLRITCAPSPSQSRANICQSQAHTRRSPARSFTRALAGAESHVMCAAVV